MEDFDTRNNINIYYYFEFDNSRKWKRICYEPLTVSLFGFFSYKMVYTAYTYNA